MRSTIRLVFVEPTVKHGRSKCGVASHPITKNPAVNKEWHQNVLREQPLPTILAQIGHDLGSFQCDGAVCHTGTNLSSQNAEMFTTGKIFTGLQTSGQFSKQRGEADASNLRCAAFAIIFLKVAFV